MNADNLKFELSNPEEVKIYTDRLAAEGAEQFRTFMLIQQELNQAKTAKRESLSTTYAARDAAFFKLLNNWLQQKSAVTYLSNYSETSIPETEEPIKSVLMGYTDEQSKILASYERYNHKQLAIQSRLNEINASIATHQNEAKKIIIPMLLSYLMQISIFSRFYQWLRPQSSKEFSEKLTLLNIHKNQIIALQTEKDQLQAEKQTITSALSHECLALKNNIHQLEDLRHKNILKTKEPPAISEKLDDDYAKLRNISTKKELYLLCKKINELKNRDLINETNYNEVIGYIHDLYPSMWGSLQSFTRYHDQQLKKKKVFGELELLKRTIVEQLSRKQEQKENLEKLRDNVVSRAAGANEGTTNIVADLNQLIKSSTVEIANLDKWIGEFEQVNACLGAFLDNRTMGHLKNLYSISQKLSASDSSLKEKLETLYPAALEKIKAESELVVGPKLSGRFLDGAARINHFADDNNPNQALANALQQFLVNSSYDLEHFQKLEAAILANPKYWENQPLALSLDTLIEEVSGSSEFKTVIVPKGEFEAIEAVNAALKEPAPGISGDQNPKNYNLSALSQPFFSAPTQPNQAELDLKKTLEAEDLNDYNLKTISDIYSHGKIVRARIQLADKILKAIKNYSETISSPEVNNIYDSAAQLVQAFGPKETKPEKIEALKSYKTALDKIGITKKHPLRYAIHKLLILAREKSEKIEDYVVIKTVKKGKESQPRRSIFGGGSGGSA